MIATGTKNDSHVISNCKVSGCKISGEASNKTEQIFGTVNNNGRLDVNQCTFTGNMYGRIVGDNTSVYVDGTKID